MFAFVGTVFSFSFLNRFWGAGFEKGSFIDKNHHKISFVLTLILSIVLGYFAHWAAALLPWAWFGMRSIAFEEFGGSLTPTTTLELLGSWLRFLTAAPVFFLFAILAHKNWVNICFLYTITTLINTAASAMYGSLVARARKKGVRLPWDFNVLVELFHGATYAVAVAYALGWT